MVMLNETDVQTKAVFGWRGLHLFHFSDSTCSQKVRIYLRLKGLPWTSHHINLARQQHLTAYYMGINPRGLVPTLIHDGKVIIESNDILQYLEEKFPSPRLIPTASSSEIADVLAAEDDLHLEIRALTMRFVFPTFLAKRPEKSIAAYERLGAGKVAGQPDPNRQRETRFWRAMNRHGGITDDQVKQAYERFRSAINRFETLLANQPYLTGDEHSVVDIAWYIYARRLRTAGYPLAELHPAFDGWFQRVHAQRDYRDEVPSTGASSIVTALLHGAQKLRHTTLVDVVTRIEARAP
ncbi:MAG: glutathione S-transferase family protein [Pseudomonadota bacterium]